jgi:hypothetical protein
MPPPKASRGHLRSNACSPAQAEPLKLGVWKFANIVIALPYWYDKKFDPIALKLEKGKLFMVRFHSRLSCIPWSNLRREQARKGSKWLKQSELTSHQSHHWAEGSSSMPDEWLGNTRQQVWIVSILWRLECKLEHNFDYSGGRPY